MNSVLEFILQKF